MVNVRLVLAFSKIELAPKVLLMVGGVTTVSVAVLLVLPVPPFVELTVPVVLFFTPELVPCTLTAIVHELLIATVPPVRLTLPLSAVAVVVPPQVLLRLFGVATTSPAGNVSVNATPVSATVLAAGLVMLTVRLVVPFTGIEAALKTLLMLGGATTVNVIGLPVPCASTPVEAVAEAVIVIEPARLPVTVKMATPFAEVLEPSPVTVPAPAVLAKVTLSPLSGAVVMVLPN
jgi:hypothetical protein